MDEIDVFDRDCNDRCDSKQHGYFVISSITKRNVSDLELRSYVSHICTNPENVRDSEGKTALHCAASIGRPALVRWLLSRGADINVQDEESGYTPLHRALFYRRIDAAVELIGQGANLSIMDHDGLTPLEHVIEDGLKPSSCHGFVYVWGTNTWNSLGYFPSKSVPTYFHSFPKRHPKIMAQKVSLGEFHSVFITSKFEVYSCGQGFGGKLGLPSEYPVAEPTQIHFPDTNVSIIDVAVGRDHTLFLESNGQVYSCGYNVNRVLGFYPAPPKVLLPQIVESLSDKLIIGLTASTYHSVAWAKDRIYVWGTDYGQMWNSSMTRNLHVIQPTSVKWFDHEDNEIIEVATGEGATVVLTLYARVYVFFKFQCRMIQPYKSKIFFTKIAIAGAVFHQNALTGMGLEPASRLEVVALSDYGEIFLWRDCERCFNLCLNSIPRHIQARDITINTKRILLVSIHGEAFEAIVEKDNAPKDHTVTLKMIKLPGIFRAISVACDPLGDNHCLIQEAPFKAPFIPCEISFSEKRRLLWNGYLTYLLRETRLDDNLHDIVIKIKTKSFPAHRYILAQRCGILLNRLHVREIEADDVEPDIFEEFLTFVYTDDCSLLKHGECPRKFHRFCKDSKADNPLGLLKRAAFKFSCRFLIKRMATVQMVGFVIYPTTAKYIRKTFREFHHQDFPKYYDVSIRCNDGITLNAHRCILSAALPYFENFFSLRWNDGSNDVVTCSHSSALFAVLLDFVYSGSTDCLIDKPDDFLFQLFILADEYMVDELKDRIQMIFLTTNFIDSKNVTEVLQFSYQYEATEMKLFCKDMILRNLAYFLETKRLSNVDDRVLAYLSSEYERGAPSRKMKPYTDAPSEEHISIIHKLYQESRTLPDEDKMPNDSSEVVENEELPTGLIDQVEKLLNAALEALTLNDNASESTDSDNTISENSGDLKQSEELIPKNEKKGSLPQYEQVSSKLGTPSDKTDVAPCDIDAGTEQK